jgi:calcium-dependent protein kinase
LLERISLQSPNEDPNRSPESVHIKYSEFLAATLDSKIYLNKERLWSLFKYFDSKNHDYLDVNDLRKTLEREGRILPDNKLNEIFEEIDKNKDGKADFADFCQMMH